MIGKIEKAHRYAREPERVQIDAFSATFKGDNGDYVIELKHGEWQCNCHTFESHAFGDTCAHVMALQEMLKTMLSDDARHFGAIPEPV
jgi:hypothetical protein